MTRRKTDEELAIKELLSFNLTPEEPYPGAKSKWKCTCLICGSEVSKSLQVVRKSSHPCANCKSKNYKSSNLMAEAQAISIMAEAGFKPLEPYMGSGKPWKSQCVICKEVSYPRLGNVKNQKTKCKNCNRNQADSNLISNRLKKLNLSLLSPYQSSRKSLQVHCDNCNESFESSTRVIFQLDIPCPNCREEIRKDFLRSVDDLFMSAGLTPKEPYVNSKTPRRCICNTCKRDLAPTLSSLRKSNSGCRYCAKLLIDKDEAEALMLKNNLRPLESFESSKKPWRSLCLVCNSECFPRLANIKSGNGGCKVCALKRRIQARTLTEEVAIEIMMNSGLTPLEPYVSSKSKWLCQCQTCGKQVRPMLNTIQQGDGGCGWCSSHLVDPSEMYEFMVSKGFEPLIDYPGSNVPWPSKHKVCGQTSSPRYASIKRGGSCKFCSNKGFQFHLPGYVYLITHSDLKAHKIGIASSDVNNDRMKSHVSLGWQVFRTKSFAIGDDAYRVEQLTLNWIRNDLGLPPLLSASDMPQGGWSETFSSDEIDLISTWHEVSKFAKLIENKSHL